jgi:hypothetical protein
MIVNAFAITQWEVGESPYDYAIGIINQDEEYYIQHVFPKAKLKKVKITDEISFYFTGSETWTKAIENHPEDNEGWTATEDAEVYASLIKGRGLTVARAAAVAREEGLVANPVSGNTLRKAVRKGDVPGVTEETLPKAPAGAGGGIASVVPGREFGKWRVVRLDRAHRSGSGHACAYCACSCGTERWVDVYHLLGGKSRSCGRCGTRGSVLGSKSELYGVYHSVVDRCSKSNNAAYRWYGARGTTVCDEWGSYANFEKWALEKGWEEGAHLSVERLDNGRGYSPDNCTLIPRSDQRFNRRSNRRVEYKGVELEVSRWAQITGIPNRVILSRLNSGWTPERALETKYVPRKRTEAPSV